MKTILNLLLAGIVAAFCCSIGNAQIIYSNNFALGTGINISNTPPTVANNFAGGTNTATWNDVGGTNNTAALLANGIQTTTLGDSWVLPFTPQTNNIYLLAASVTFTTSPGSWTGIGFAQNDNVGVNVPLSPTDYGRFTDNQAGATNSPRGSDWMTLTELTGNVQYFGGLGTANTIFSSNGAFTPGPGTHTMKVILNTKGSPWSVTAYVDGVQMGKYFTYVGSNPTIRAVGITQNVLTNATAIQWNYLALSALQLFITNQPVSAAVSGGTAFTNTVAVYSDTNGGAFFYQWYNNNLPIAGATNAALILNPVTTDDASTNYYVIVTNNYGAVTSSVVSLTVLESPGFTSLSPTTYTNPITLFGGTSITGTNYVGSTPTFSVSAVGAQPLAYQWYADGASVNGATNAGFTFPNCQMDSPTNFICIVSNIYGEATNAWSVVYLPTPLAPYPQAVLASQPIAFWRLNEPDNGAGNDGVIANDYQSGNNGIYTNVALGQPGYNNSAEPTETSVEFALGTSPLYSYVGHIQGVDFAVTNGGNAEFTVEAWASGFGDVPGSPVVSEGTYAVNEEFGLGSDTNTTTMYQFYVRAANGTVYKADSAIPVNDATWHHLVGVCDEANSNVSLYIDGSLAATTVIPANSGIYEASAPLAIGAGIKSGLTDYTLEFNGNVDDVAAYNQAFSAGQVIYHYYEATGNPVSVSLVPTPPANVAYQVNQTLTIPVTVSGTPPLGYYWINLTTGGVLGSGATSTNGSLDATLTIPNASASLGGDQLELVATNAGSSANGFVTLSSVAAPVTLDYSSPILYSNYFNGGTRSIAGMPLTAANALVGGTNATWVDAIGTNATGIMQANGIDASTDRDSWVLPFTPHAGYIYTVSASVTFTGNPGSWIGLGFAQNVPTNAAVGYGRFSDGGTTPPDLGPNGYNWLIMQYSGTVQYFEGPGGYPPIGLTNGVLMAAGSATHTVQVILDTTGAQWVQYAYIDGVPLGTNTYSSNPPIGAVGITQTTLSAPGNLQWNYFALSQVSPSGGLPPYAYNPAPPTNVTLLADTSLSIPVTTFGSAPFGYYWSNTNTAAVLGSGAASDTAPLSANLTIADVPSSWNGNTLALVVTNAYGTNISLVTLTVTGAVNTNPTNIVFSVTGNQMTLGWPTDHTGWTLQAQTNTLSVGLSTNWVDITGSTSTNQVVIPINPTNGSVFYRLILP